MCHEYFDDARMLRLSTPLTSSLETRRCTWASVPLSTSRKWFSSARRHLCHLEAFNCRRQCPWTQVTKSSLPSMPKWRKTRAARFCFDYSPTIKLRLLKTSIRRHFRARTSILLNVLLKWFLAMSSRGRSPYHRMTRSVPHNFLNPPLRATLRASKKLFSFIYLAWCAHEVSYLPPLVYLDDRLISLYPHQLRSSNQVSKHFVRLCSTRSMYRENPKCVL